jgi:hypothetical protein
MLKSAVVCMLNSAVVCMLHSAVVCMLNSAVVWSRICLFVVVRLFVCCLFVFVVQWERCLVQWERCLVQWERPRN